jgi:hypothetical protein
VQASFLLTLKTYGKAVKAILWLQIARHAGKSSIFTAMNRTGQDIAIQDPAA